MLKNFIRIFGGDPNKRAIDKAVEIVDQVNALETQFEALSDEALRGKTDEFRLRLSQGDSLDGLLPEAFAAVREASKRTIGLRHYDVQIIGGLTLHQGKIAEMRTGEGKTLVATLPLYLNALTGRGAHLITVNDYLARRDARWMAPVYTALGLSVGVLQMASRTENGKKAFVVDLEKHSPHEDQHQLKMTARYEAYAADITYGTNSEFGFDYLRDNMTYNLEDRVQRRRGTMKIWSAHPGTTTKSHYFAIVDEVDNVLIDEARTPLIISGPASDNTEWYARMAQVVRQLRVEDYEISERDNTVVLTEIGEARVEDLLGQPLRDPDRPEDITPEQARLMGYLEQALRAQFLFRRNKEYIVQGGKVIIVDEFTGRLMPGRRWSDGLHQAVEAKEGVRIEAENVTYATITIQNYFRMYEKLAGMSGTALTESEEFHKIYKLDVLPIPTNLEYQALRAHSPLVETEDKDEEGYKYRFYTRRDDPNKHPVFWRRQDYPDVVFRSEDAKFRGICLEILRYHALGRPVLVGTTSVELSERLSNRLRAEPLRRLAQVTLFRRAWLEQNKRAEEGFQFAELKFLSVALEQLDIAEMRKFARQLDLPFAPDDETNLERLCAILGLPAENKARLKGCLQGGIPHQVLNARKHTEESQIIAGAGAFGAVTIATNMAGRGVDIKLGGELAEQIIAAVNRVLRRAGYDDPYDLTLEERRQALKRLDAGSYGIYETEIRFFLNHMDEMETVRALGGLHIIGSERHEARRIDNQLRGRSARQGDPGSSRFYLSMEDELIRRFGGQQADGMMQRLKYDDAMPLEFGIVGRIIEQAQTRVEGANFDVRKHLLEYDDVLNAQRASVYDQRDQIFVKDDLHEDVTQMLRAEITRHVQQAFEPEARDKGSSGVEAGPWRLLAWLDQIQPTRQVGNTLLPSYTLRLLVDQILENTEPEKLSSQVVIERLLAIASDALEAEAEHVHEAIQGQIEQSRTRLEASLQEKQETLDTFTQALADGGGEESEAPKSPRELTEELSALLHLPLRLSPEDQRRLRDDPRQQARALKPVIEGSLVNQAVLRLVGAAERRLGESLEINPAALPLDDWEALSEQIEEAVEAVLRKRHERLVGTRTPGGFSGGQIARDLENALARFNGAFNRVSLISLLIMMTEGARTAFDKKTHRRVQLRTTRLTYPYYAASLLKGRDPDQVASEVLEHLEKTQSIIRRAWGLSEWARLANTPLSDLSAQARSGLQRALGDEIFERLSSETLGSAQALGGEVVGKIVDELGRQALTEIYRQLLLSVISDLWVDYLTQMEALRISIGLEAYAQRDPLVQYKTRASEMYHTLIENTRLGVVTRMFTFRPRDLSSVRAAVNAPALDENSDGAAVAFQEPQETAKSHASDMDQEDQPAADNDNIPGVEPAWREDNSAPPAQDDLSSEAAANNTNGGRASKRRRRKR